MVLLYQEEGFALIHDPLHNWLYASWVGNQSAEVLHQNYLLILQHTRSKRCVKLLNDSSEDKDGWSNLTEWLVKDCFPELAKSGIQAVAWVLPTDPQALYDTRKVITLIQAPLIDVFNDVELAHNWLILWPQPDILAG